MIYPDPPSADTLREIAATDALLVDEFDFVVEPPYTFAETFANIFATGVQIVSFVETGPGGGNPNVVVRGTYDQLLAVNNLINGGDDPHYHIPPYVAPRLTYGEYRRR